MIRVIVLNGPLGIGKSSLQDALVEAVPGAAGIDGDAVVQLNPEPAAEDYLARGIGVLARYHHDAGYRTFVINHIWTTAEAMAAVRAQFTALDPAVDWHVLLLTLAPDSHHARIESRQAARIMDERDFERRVLAEELAALGRDTSGALGRALPVDAGLDVLVARVLALVGLDPPSA